MIDAREILVRGPNWVGDLVMATPGFRALRTAYPQARITLHVRPGLAPLLEGAPWFDEVLPVSSYGRRDGGLALLREGLALRRRRFDLGVCLPDSFASAWLIWLAGIRCKVGYGLRGRRPLLDLAVDPPPARRGRRLVPREQHVLGLMEAIGCPARGVQLELFVSAEQESRTDRLLEGCGVPGHGPLVALAPGASYGSAKQWPVGSFAAVGDALAAAGAHVLLVGAPSEAGLTGRVAAAMRAPAFDLTLALDLGTLKGVLRRARLLVCNDAGARHVAVAFGVPSVVLFGPTSLAKTAWNLEQVTVLASKVACRPCYHRECPVDHRCMERLAVRRVSDAALAALADPSQRARGGA